MKKLMSTMIVVIMFLIPALMAGCGTGGANETTTAATTVPATTTEYVAAELAQPEWTLGSLSGSGAETTTNSDLRTSEYLRLADYGGALVNSGYSLTYYVYDAQQAFLGRSDAQQAFSVAGIREAYPNGVWFRVLLDTVDQTVLTARHVDWSGVLFYGPGDAVPEQKETISFENVVKMSACQDGAIYDGKLFLFTANGSCTVFDLETGKKCGYIQFSGTSALIPHANSVCFGNQQTSEFFCGTWMRRT